jgi:ATP-binding protein involved in chromosome partitioning
MVTTPQDVALLDVRKAMGMFQRLQVPILGVVENMSLFACPRCGETTAIFGRAGGQRLAEEYGVPLLAQLPLDPEIREGGDAGVPITIRRPDSPASRAFRELAAAVARRLEESAGARPLPKLG